MNKTWTIAVVCLNFLFLNFSNAQCPVGDILLTSQAEVDFFATNFPNCTSIHARLIVGNPTSMVGTNISDLSGLAGVQETDGLIIQNNPILDDLNGLQNLKRINGDLIINNNLELDGVNHLTSLQGRLKSLSIVGNGEINDLSGLENISLSGGDLAIEHNPALLSLTGLGSISSVYLLRIGYNPLLTDIAALATLSTAKQVKITNLVSLQNLAGLAGLKNVNSSFELVDLPLLSDLQGLSSLQVVGGTFTLSMLPELAVLDGLENLNAVHTMVLMNNEGLKNIQALTGLNSLQNLQLTSNKIIETLEGLEGITEIDNLLLLNNASLLNVFGLQNLTTVKLNAQLSLNPALLNLNDFSAITEIRGALAIVDNDALHSISGVENGALSGAQLIIMDNAVLSHCHIKNVCEYVDLTAPLAVIANNNTGCKTVPEVHTACQLLSLPVELLSFEVQKKGEAAQLIWETASEFNNAGFEIQRSQDGQIWKTIGWVASKEIKQAKNIYQYNDTPESKGHIYYRLLQMDNDGLTKTGDVKSLNFGYVDSNLSVFPNPAQDRVTIEYQFAKELAKEVEIRLYDLTGQLIKTARSNQPGSLNLDLQGLPAGYYTLVVDGFSTKLVIGN